MRTKIIFFILAVFSSTIVFSQSGESEFKEVTINSKKSTPPELTLSVKFFDSNANQALDAGEEGKFVIKIKNTGQFDAEDLKISVQNLSNSNTITLDTYPTNLGKLSPDSEKNLDIFFKGDDMITAGSHEFEITVTEKDGYNPEPQKITINSREKAAPLLAISDFEFTTPDGGKIENGQPVELHLILQNNGDGKANDILVKFETPSNLITSGSKEFAFMSLDPGKKQDLKYVFIPDEAFTGNEISIKVDVTEKTKRYGASKLCKTTTEKELLSSDLISTQPESDVLYRGGGDPLKGLNTSAAKKNMEIGEYYALIIGIDNYSGAWTPLNNAKNDAQTIEDVLKSKYKFDHFRVLYNDQATRKAILKEFEWLVANVKETDNLFIYYSGHGEYKKDLNKGYWVPVDASTTSIADYVSNNDIQTFLSGIKSKHTLLIADACFSGDIFRGKTMVIPFENSEKYFAKVHDLPSRKAITSGGIEPVMDGGKDGHSVFAYYLLKALNGNQSRFYDASQLYESIKIPVVNNSEQTPNFDPIKNTGDEGGQFIFIKK
jgi:hypothetical protein